MDQYWNTIWQYKVCTANFIITMLSLPANRKPFLKNEKQYLNCTFVFSFSSTFVTLMPQQTSIGYNGTIQACWCLFRFLFPENIMLKDEVKKFRNNNNFFKKKNNNQNSNWTKRKIKCALCTFFQQYYWYHITFTKQCYRYVDVSNSTQIYPNTQMLGALCPITGGQRDLFWFPKFDRKTTFS